MNGVPLSATCLRFAGRTIVHSFHAAWDSRDILPILRFGENSWEPAAQAKHMVLETLPDRRSLGTRVGNYSDRHRLGAPRVAPCLREARSRVGRIRPIPATSVACATCWKRHIACKLPHKEHQFSATISETRFSHWRGPHAGGGRRRLECSYGCGQHDKRSCVAAFQLSPRQRKHNLSDQLRAHPRPDRNGIA